MDIYYCEKKNKCQWKAFALNADGMSLGRVENALPAWREWHEKMCGGKLVQAEIVEKAN